MGWFSKGNARTLQPEEVPPDKLTPLSRKYMDWKTGAAFMLGLFIVIAFIKTVATNPGVTSFAIVEGGEGPSRFAGTLSILVVLFAFFTLAIFLLKKMVHKK